MIPSGYSHPLYAASFKGFGIPLELQGCEGWLLKRSIAKSNLMDAMGCYPLFSCNDWSQLPDDLDRLSSELVSVVLVCDPFGNYDKTLLHSCFDHVVPFKEHFVVDLEQPLENFVSKTHLKFASKAQNHMQVEACNEPESHIDRWCYLYDELIARKNITGIRAFSRNAFEKQLQVPGIVLFQATADGEVIGLDWWYVQGDVAQGHLVVMSERGYELHAGYALKLSLLQYFKGRVRWVNLGGTPGTKGSEHEGLAAFKHGWASETRTAWLCGRIVNKKIYNELVLRKKINSAIQYFPHYRQGELL